MNFEKTYMVFRDGKHGCKPRRHHPNIPAAMEEAVRLARMVPEGTFLVVEVIGSVAVGERGVVEARTAV